MNTLLVASRALIGCAIALACAVAQATEPFTLAGHALGLSYDAVLKDSRYDCDSLAGCFLYSVCQYQAPEGRQFAGVAVDRVSLYFQGERLSGIEAEFPADQFDMVVITLGRDYGPATEDAAKPGDNGPLTWRRGSQVLRIERYARPGRSSVIIAERSFISELLER